MKLGTKGQYAVMALVNLACYGEGKPVSLAEIAAQESLPITYLEQIFTRLRQKGLVESTRGQQGGYRLARPANTIRLSEILEAVEESLKMTRCQKGVSVGCTGTEGRCLTHHVWAGLRRHIHQYLSDISLADVCEKRAT